MELVYLLNKGMRRDNEEEKEDDIADLPWLTDTDLVQIQQELYF
jgi:hypothetical protein